MRRKNHIHTQVRELEDKANIKDTISEEEQKLHRRLRKEQQRFEFV